VLITINTRALTLGEDTLGLQITWLPFRALGIKDAKTQKASYNTHPL
jgi:hypothetical protein